jgi:hypothetical protein
MITRSGTVLIFSLSAIAAALGGASISAAADLGAPATPTGREFPGWTLTVTPYAWATWLDGTETVKGRSVDVQVDPIELIQDLNKVPFMGYAEARKGPFAVYGDLVYASVGIDADGVRSRSVRPEISGSLSAALGLDYEQTILELGGAYQIVGGTTAFDLLAGARYWHQRANLELTLDGSLDIGGLDISGSRAIARSGSVDWVDPVIGARIRHQLAPGQDLLLRGDIGGFGAGSEFSWNIVAAYSFVLCTEGGLTYSGVLGYRLLDVDYEQGSGRTRYEYDVLQHGPLSGLTIKF